MGTRFFVVIMMSVVLAGLCFPEVGFARPINFALAEQVNIDPERVLPRSELYTLAVDGYTFFRVSDGFAGFYHSGYWADAYGEVRPFSVLTANARFVIYNPGASYGIISETRFFPFVSFTWRDNLTHFGLFNADLLVRYFDQGRETIGAGLTIEEKEASGLSVELRFSDFRLKHFWNGTGGYYISGDLIGLQLDYLSNTLGLYTFITDGTGTAAVGLYSSRELLEGLKYAVELSHRKSARGGLVGLEYTQSWQLFDARVRLQYRRYQNGFANDAVGQIEQDYLSIEQEDKAYTNSANLFTVDDDASVRSAIFNLVFRPTWWLRIFTENELAQFDYAAFGLSSNYFYRHGLAGCLRKGDNVCANVFYSNRMTSAVYHLGIQDTANKPYFQKQEFVALEGRFRF